MFVSVWQAEWFGAVLQVELAAPGERVLSTFPSNIPEYAGAYWTGIASLFTNPAPNPKMYAASTWTAPAPKAADGSKAGVVTAPLVWCTLADGSSSCAAKGKVGL